MPLNKAVLTDETGDRKVQPHRLVVLGELLDMFRAHGAKVIVYLPPLLPRVFEQEPRQVGIVHGLGDALREVTEKRDFDFCDLAASGQEIGCTNDEFYDEHHMARGCNKKMVHALASCAKRFGPKLKGMLAD